MVDYPRPTYVPVWLYFSMMIVSNVGWIVGTLLYHAGVVCR